MSRNKDATLILQAEVEVQFSLKFNLTFSGAMKTRWLGFFILPMKDPTLSGPRQHPSSRRKL